MQNDVASGLEEPSVSQEAEPNGEKENVDQRATEPRISEPGEEPKPAIDDELPPVTALSTDLESADAVARRQISELSTLCESILNEVERTALFGLRRETEMLLTGLLSGGHVLLEGHPGLGKTRLVKILAQVLGLSFRRGQFTPDRLPSDITGDIVFNAVDGTSSFRPGPIFCHLFLADEINRAPAKTQAALLEAMEEWQVTSDGETYLLGNQDPLLGPTETTKKESSLALMGAESRNMQCLGSTDTENDKRIFMVCATQNSIEHEGTYALPEAQLDRFMMRVLLNYPDDDSLLKILETADSGTSPMGMMLDFDRLCHYKQVIRDHVELGKSTRTHVKCLLRAVEQHEKLAIGASPRAGLALVRCAKTRAALQGRMVATNDDVDAFVAEVLAHRLIPTRQAILEAVDHQGELIDTILSEIREGARLAMADAEQS